MADFASQQPRGFYAKTYDEVKFDWPGENDFCRQLAARYPGLGQALLELACGMGRIALTLAEQGFDLVGLDSSPVMLEAAPGKSPQASNHCRAEGAMLSNTC